jgi:hypothetical protein
MSGRVRRRSIVTGSTELANSIEEYLFYCLAKFLMTPHHSQKTKVIRGPRTIGFSPSIESKDNGVWVSGSIFFGTGMRRNYVEAPIFSAKPHLEFVFLAALASPQFVRTLRPHPGT